MAIDVERSTIVVHVGKSGLLSAAAHDHTIEAPISSGTIRESPAPHVEFTVKTAKMTLRPDPKVDPKTELTIQKDMEEMTLETKKFPEITFRSSRVEKLADGQWKVDGDLSLHGVTKPVSLTVKQNDGGSQADRFRNQTHQYRRWNDQGEKRSGDRFSDLPPPLASLLVARMTTRY
jgi:polyisoprenoid-binding protein YceI